MFRFSKPEQLVLIIILIAGIIGTSMYISKTLDGRKTPYITKKRLRPTASTIPYYVTVHVAGAVVNPGIYRLRYGSRVVEAIQTAGGVVQGADYNSLNLAQKVDDGMKIEVPYINIQIPESQPSPESYTININTASAKEIDSIPGIGYTLACDIVAYRSLKGRYNSIDDLMDIEGIGEKKLESIKPYISLE